MRTHITVTTAAIALAVAALAGAVVSPTLATASTAGTTTSPSARQESLSMTFHPRGGDEFDAAPQGMSVGDQFFEHGRLAGAAHGRYSLTGELIRMPGAQTPPWESQHFTLHVRGGTIEAIGQHPATDSFTVPVVGGTGSWQHVSGTLRIDHGHARLDVRR
jgi:hypothetical protein